MRFLRLSPPLRSLSFTHSSRRRRRVMGPPSPTATNRIDDFEHVEKKGMPMSGKNYENLPENEGVNEANSYNEKSNLYERKVLPPELSRNVVTLTCDSVAQGGVCDVYLVGTTHISKDSCLEVEAVIDYLKPQVVFMELCPGRISYLQPQNVTVPTFGEMVEMWKKNHNLFGIIYGWFLAKVASKLEVRPGGEFLVAHEGAIKYGSKVMLGDRPVQITLRRTWAKMPLWHKTKLVYALLFSAFFWSSPEVLTKTLKEKYDDDMSTRDTQVMAKHFPTLMETLVHERDQYMSVVLLKVASEHNSVVAVVGKEHLQGIQKNWKQPVEMKELLTMPSENNTIRVGKTLTTIGVTVAGVAIISGLYFSMKK